MCTSYRCFLSTNTFGSIRKCVRRHTRRLENLLKMEIINEKTCRACLIETHNLESVFITKEHSAKSLGMMLQEFANVKVTRGDGLPEVICIDCVKNLWIACRFKEQCERTDATLREYLKNPKIEFIKVELNESVEPQHPHATDQQSVPVAKPLLKSKRKNPKKREKRKKTAEKSSYKCGKCEKIFRRLNFYKRHLKVHTESKQKCVHCDVTFNSVDEYNNHSRTYHKMYKCKLCDRKFRSPHGLSYHVTVNHKGIRRFQCTFPDCNKRFALKQALDKHKILHTDVKDHLCPLCGKAYATYDSLHYHLKNHKGERPHLCVHCGKTFKQACHLKTHMWMHTGIKPHVCKLCGKCYTSGHQLKKHWKKYCGSDNAIGITDSYAEQPVSQNQTAAEIIISEDMTELSFGLI